MTIPTPVSPESTILEDPAQREAERRQRTTVIGAIIGVIVILALLGAALFYLFRPETPVDQVGRIRDIFIIFMALESLLIGAALVVLIVQVASLINLLQNEVRPILEATNETVNHLRGTTEFLGENMVEPVIKASSYMAGMKRMLELFGVKKK
jgi:hypothetical protein